MRDVVIVSACRTAIGTFGGTLRDLNAATLASVTMQAAVKRAGIDPAVIDDVRYGCCLEHHDTLNISRVGALMAGIPDSVPAATINRVCISSSIPWKTFSVVSSLSISASMLISPTVNLIFMA